MYTLILYTTFKYIIFYIYFFIIDKLKKLDYTNIIHIGFYERTGYIG